LKERVRNGEITERRLARMTGVSQPHVHNVLKGVRALSPALSDRVLVELHMNIQELWSSEGNRPAYSAPFAVDPVGPRNPYPRELFRGRHPLPPSHAQGLGRPVVFQLAPDPSMEPDLRPNDLILVDQSEAVRRAPDYSSIYLLHLGGWGLARYVRWEPGRLYVADAKTRETPALWQSVRLEEQDILKVIRGRIVWIGREMETPS
jgi:hypothetical protein